MMHIQKNIRHLLTSSRGIDDLIILRFDSMRVFWPMTFETKFCSVCGLHEKAFLPCLPILVGKKYFLRIYFNLFLEHLTMFKILEKTCLQILRKTGDKSNYKWKFDKPELKILEHIKEYMQKMY